MALQHNEELAYLALFHVFDHDLWTAQGALVQHTWALELVVAALECMVQMAINQVSGAKP